VLWSAQLVASSRAPKLKLKIEKKEKRKKVKKLKVEKLSVLVELR
jgi:hypothetical protein